jgi:two-component system LytT family sensor kinase
MKLLKSGKYHLLNFLGWQVYTFSTLTFSKISYAKFADGLTTAQLNALYYTLWEGFLCALLGFVLSYIILLFLETRFNLSNLRRKDWWNLFFVFSLAQIIYHFALWPLLDIPVMYYFGSSNIQHLTLLMKITNVPGFLAEFLVWLFIVLAIKIYEYINEVKFNRLKLESSLKESQLNSLKGQINPHFMFNSLNNIRGLILENPLKSREMITRLSEMLRYSLTKNDINTIALEEEIEMVENFIEISRIQLENRLKYTPKIDTGLLKMEIPPMIIQMLIENAVKHGISKLKEGGEIILDIHNNDKALKIVVSNTGVLSIGEDSTQLGIKNIEKRLHLIYGENANFKLQEIENQVVAEITIPFLSHEKDKSCNCRRFPSGPK